MCAYIREENALTIWKCFIVRRRPDQVLSNISPVCSQTGATFGEQVFSYYC